MRRTSTAPTAAGRALAWPRQCPLCLDWTTRPLCAACLSRFVAPVPRCARCALRLTDESSPCPACTREPLPFVRIVCAGDYGFPWDRLITALKFHGRLDLASPLAMALTSAVGNAAPAPVDLVVPVPLGRSRLAERGHNQSWEIARRMARAMKLPAAPRALLRLRDTGHQVGLTRQDRRHNLAGALCAEPSQVAALQGRHVALVDDVLTTGATAAACAEELLRAGAASVQAWVVARTPAPQDA